MALPAGRYGVTKNQLLKIKKLPMNTIKLIEELTEKFDLLGTAALKNSTSVVTQSTDLVESGAVYDAIVDTVGWVSDNQAKLYNWTGSGSGITFTYSKDALILNGIATSTATLPSSANVPEEGKYTLKAGTYEIYCDTENVNWQVLNTNPVAVIGDNTKPFTITEDKTVFIRASIPSGGSFTNKTVHVEIRHVSVDEVKADNTVITNNIETGNYSRAYAVNEHFMNDGAFRTVKATVASGDEITDNNSFADTLVDVIPFAGTGKTCNSIADVVAQYGGRTDLALFIKCSNTLSGIITNSAINASGKIFITYVGGGNYDWFGQFAIKGFAVGRFNSSTGYVNHSVISSP